MDKQFDEFSKLGGKRLAAEGDSAFVSIAAYSKPESASFS